MKVAVIHYTAPAGEVGGVEVVIDHHARLLSEEGAEVHLIFGRGGELQYQNLSNHEIPLLSGSHPRVIKVQEEILREGRESEDFRSLKNEIKSDLLRCLKGVETCIVHNIPSMPFNFAATAAINEISDESNLKMIFWIHDSALTREEWKDRVGKFPLNLLHHKSLTTKYVTVTNARARELSQLPSPYDVRATVVPNGVSVNEYIRIDDVTKQLMKKLGLSFENYIILTPVRVTPRKNIELALYVVDELRHLMKAVREIKLVITGPPDHQAQKMGAKYLDYLQEIMERRDLHDTVIFCHDLISRRRQVRNGQILTWGVADAYNIADLVFLPSREEGFGLPVIEAGASRRPVFCSRIPPFQELIRDDIEGYMFDLSEDPKSIAFRIYRKYLEDAVDNNFVNIMKRFSWDSIFKSKILPLL